MSSSSSSDHRVGGLITELIHRLTPNPNPNTIKYITRILTSRMSPSITPDESSIALSIKSILVKQGKLSDALSFADLYSKFCNKTGPGSVQNKWALLYLLKTISQDSKTVSDGLPVLFHPKMSQKSEKDGNVGNGGGGGVLLVAKDSENLRDLAYREYVKEDNNVTEEVLVRDVLYACQGIDGRYVLFDESADGYILPDSIKVGKSVRLMVRKLCELGWLFRKVKGYVDESVERFCDEDVGTVGQAFCAALQDELGEYYKLLAVLQAQVMNVIPLVSKGGGGGNYLSLRRLLVWFAEPMVKMRLMAVLVDSCKSLNAGAIHMHAQHGDPLLHDFMKRLLRRVCSPLF